MFQLNSDKQKAPQELDAQNEVFLRFLCIITFIYCGLYTFSNTFLAITKDSLSQIMEIFEDETMHEIATLLIEANVWFFIFSAILYAVSIYGAYKMLKLNKIGFHFYAMSQLLLLIVSVYFLPETSSMLSFIVTILFIYFFSRFLKYMH
ncbi:MAG: hypothetical protein PHP31_03040 [Lentimicrobiaceae bacterium]|nr:hypothetical protein [Lentimicrobiaceae bacterium]